MVSTSEFRYLLSKSISFLKWHWKVPLISEAWLHDHLMIEFAIIVSKIKKASAYYIMNILYVSIMPLPWSCKWEARFLKSGINNRDNWKSYKKGIHVIGRNHFEKGYLIVSSRYFNCLASTVPFLSLFRE